MYKQKTTIFREKAMQMYKFNVFTRFLAILLVAVTLATFVGCDISDNNDKNNDKDNTTENQGSQSGSTNENGESTNPDENKEDSISKYSQILQNILTNEHYNDIIHDARNGNESLYETGDFKPHPNAFLAQEGFDVDAIKKGEVDCYTMSYVLDEEPNELYMYTRVDNGDYYSNYLLKYHLTDKEMDDYDFVHDDPESATYYYIQACFINNEISKLKTPTIVGTSKMLKDSFESLTESMCKTKLAETPLCDIIIINPNEQEYRFRLILIPRYTNTAMAYYSYTTDLDCSGPIHFQKDILFQLC